MKEEKVLTPYGIHKQYIDKCEEMLASGDKKAKDDFVELVFSIYDDPNQMSNLPLYYRDNSTLEDVEFNLKYMKGRIELLISQMLITNERAALGATNVNISQSQQQNQKQSQELEIEFQELLNKYEDDADIVAKINKIKEVALSDISKNERWKKLKEVIVWLTDKGVDVGISLLPSIITALR